MGGGRVEVVEGVGLAGDVRGVVSAPRGVGAWRVGFRADRGRRAGGCEREFARSEGRGVRGYVFVEGLCAGWRSIHRATLPEVVIHCA